MVMPQPPKSLQIEAGLLKPPPRGYWMWTGVSAIGPPASSDTMPETSYRPGMTGDGVGEGESVGDGAAGDDPHPASNNEHRTATRIRSSIACSRCCKTMRNGGSDIDTYCSDVVTTYRCAGIFTGAPTSTV